MKSFQSDRGEGEKEDEKKVAKKKDNNEIEHKRSSKGSQLGELTGKLNLLIRNNSSRKIKLVCVSLVS